MPNRSKQKGTRYETLVAGYMAAHGLPVHRAPAHGVQDQGDLTGLPDWALQCKAQASLALAEWVTAAQKQAANKGSRFCAVIHKRRMRPVEESYVTISLSTFVELLQLLEDARQR